MTGRVRFRYFAMFAGMRTGSNFLEQNLNQFPDIRCHGELFNPHFVGGPKRQDVLGVTIGMRRADPFPLIDLIQRQDPKITPGFRFFHDHDQRVLERCLDDPLCAKVILTRNPLDSYISRKIAAKTDQWKLTDINHQKTARIAFDPEEFREHLHCVESFQTTLRQRLQVTGQAAYHIEYDDLQSLDVLNGLARFLGSRHRATRIDTKLKKQNPTLARDKVSNYDEMKKALGDMDFPGLSRATIPEQSRGPGVPKIIVGNSAPLVFVPISGAPSERVLGWMAAHEPSGSDGLETGLNQKSFRRWRRTRPGFQSFSVVRHPVARAHDIFCENILSPGNGSDLDLRRAIIRDYNVSVPEKDVAASDYDEGSHRLAFLAFLKFLKLNLENLTGLRAEPAWRSQSAIIEGISRVMPLGHIVHEQHLLQSLGLIEAIAGLPTLPVPERGTRKRRFSLGRIYDTDIEAATREAYARDYLNFGFGNWETA